MNRIYTDAEAFSQWPVADRVAALKALLPRELLEQALARSARPTRYCRRLPGWFLLWFVVGIGLFARDSYQQVYKWLTPFRGRTPTRSTFTMARRRLGLAPLRWLAEQVATLLATPDTPGTFHRGYRLMGIDGFVLDIPDHPTLERVFGRPRSGRGVGAFPQVRVMSLCELGTHLMWKSQIKPIRRGEPTAVGALLSHLRADMLLIWDRGFFSYRLIQQVVVEQKAQLLARVKTNLVFRTTRRLADGSYLSKVYASANDRRADRGGVVVRVIEYTLTDPNRPGCGEKHRLVTTLLDEVADPAVGVVELYHERWEHEGAIGELKTHQRERPVLRSRTVAGVVQEVYALLVAHALVRRLMFAAAARAGVAPRRVSFTGTLKILRTRLAECPSDEAGRAAWVERLIAEVSQEILPPRRQRHYPRVLKKPTKPWPRKRPKHTPKGPLKQRFRDTVNILN